MKTQHTPGPWGLEYDGSLLMPYKRGNHIVTAGAIAPDGASQEEKRANMKLIAAAPELLEALNDALKRISEAIRNEDIPIDLIPDKVLSKWETAITKAIAN